MGAIHEILLAAGVALMLVICSGLFVVARDYRRTGNLLASFNPAAYACSAGADCLSQWDRRR